MRTNDNTEPCPTCSMSVNKSAIKLAARVAELESFVRPFAESSHDIDCDCDHLTCTCPVEPARKLMAHELDQDGYLTPTASVSVDEEKDVKPYGLKKVGYGSDGTKSPRAYEKRQAEAQVKDGASSLNSEEPKERMPHEPGGSRTEPAVVDEPSVGPAARAATEEFLGPCSPSNHGDFNRLLDLMVHVGRVGFSMRERTETALVLPKGDAIIAANDALDRIAQVARGNDYCNEYALRQDVEKVSQVLDIVEMAIPLETGGDGT